MRKLSKGDFAKIAEVPCCVKGIEVGSLVQILGEPETVGYTSKVKVELLAEKGRIVYWEVSQLEPVKISELREIEGASKQIEIIQRNPKSLKSHPQNSEIYGKDESVSDLVEKIKLSGIIHPLIITEKGVIISGNRRCKAAIELGIKLVPVIVQKFQNQLEQLEFLLISNASREKTNEQRCKEARLYKKIEGEKAELRKRSNLLVGQLKKDYGDEEMPKKGKTSQIIGERVGLSASSIERGETVIQKIQDYKEQGKEKEAQELTELLNKSITGANKHVKDLKRTEEKISDRTAEGFPYQIGDICQIKAEKRTELMRYGGFWGVVVEAKGATGKIKLYDRIETVKRENLVKVNLPENRRASAEEIMNKLYAIGSREIKESIEVDILISFSRRVGIYSLTPLEEDLLSLISKSHLSVISA